MRKNRLLAILSILLLLALTASLSLSSCALQFDNAPILLDEANAIQSALDPLIAEKANALDAEAARYEASGEILKDENGADVNMPAHIAELRADATALRTLTYEPYALAIMDDVYARSYIGVYRSVLSMLPTMVDILAKDFLLDQLTDEEITTEALIVCYTLAIDDIFASYVDNKTAEEEDAMPTSYVGIGIAVVQRTDGYIDVISVTRNSPAEEGGVLPGDILTAVNGDDISDIDYNQVVNLVRGEPNTPITLTFTRGGEPYTVTLTRRIVENVTVEYKMLGYGEGSTGYIRISEFSAGTFSEFIAAVEALEAMGATEFIFDVRSNPGGNAEAVIAILEYILPDDISEPIVRFDSREGSTSFYSTEDYLSWQGADRETVEKFKAAENHALNARIAVLCNEYTASAGELFTSCLMDFGVAEVYGTTTYGKGLGQSSFRVSDYYAYAELGISRYTYFEMGYFVVPAFYYSPPISDNYHNVGVVPHHAVTLSEEAAGYYISAIPEAVDNQLIAAAEFVQSDKAFTPPPIKNSDGTNAPELPPSASNEGGLSPTNVFLFTVFGILLAAAICVTVYLVVDFRRAAKRQSDLFTTSDDTENDN